MSPLAIVGSLLGCAVALSSILKAGFAVAQFFADLSANIRALTDAVRTLTTRLDEHRTEFSTLRERVAALESWREDATA